MYFFSEFDVTFSLPLFGIYLYFSKNVSIGIGLAK